MKTELDRVNPPPAGRPPTVDIGYSAVGPIVQALADAILIITGEQPGRTAIAKRLERS
jgi:hypothetical protein